MELARTVLGGLYVSELGTGQFVSCLCMHEMELRRGFLTDVLVVLSDTDTF